MAQDTSFPPVNTVSAAPAAPVVAPDPAVVPQAPVHVQPSADSTAAAVTSLPSLQPAAPGTLVQAHEVHVDGDVQGVPQEGIGLGVEGTSEAPAIGVSTPVPSENPTPAPALEPTPTVVAEPEVTPGVIPESSQNPEPEPEATSEIDASNNAPLADTDAPVEERVVAPDASTENASADTDAAVPPADGEKSPLDILEEILAGAESEKKQAEEEQRKKDQEEAEFQAQLAAKQAEYQAEADQKLQESAQLVEEAKQRREEVDQELLQQGKIDPTDSGQGDEFAIHQLVHQKPE